MKKSKNSNGVITVLVSLLLVGILSLGTVVLEAGRFQAAKTQLAEANASAATSMIAAYDSDLYARYGLLAIDTERFTSERCMEYLNFNSDLSVGYKGNRVSRMYTIESVELEGMYNLTYPSVLKRQILSRAKYHVIPQDYELNVYTMNAFFADFQNKCQYVSDKLAPVANGIASVGTMSDIDGSMLSAINALYTTFLNNERSDSNCDITLSSATVGILPSTTGTFESSVPTEDLTDINNALTDATTVLGGDGTLLSYGNGTVVSETDVSIDVSLVSDIQNQMKDIISAGDISQSGKDVAIKARRLAQGLNTAINMLNDDAEGNLLLNSYVIEYFSNRNNRVQTYSAPAKGTSINGTMENVSFASACVEYVFGGLASEKENQESACDYLTAIRLINNLYSAMTDSATFNENNLYSVIAHIVWANYESCIDVELMAKYNVSVPFNKNRMILPVSNPQSVASAFASKDVVNAMRMLGYHDGANFNVPGAYSFSYEDSLAFALWFVPNTNKILRIADLIQLEMRYREQHVENTVAQFLMSNQNTYCRVKSVSKFSSLLPVISIDSNSGVKGMTFQSIKYAGY